MERLLTLAAMVARAGAWFGGALIILAAVIVSIDIVIRKLFSLTLGGADELSGYALAIGTAWSLAYALYEKAHVRIDSLYVVLPRGIRAALDILGLAVFIGFMTLVTVRSYAVLAQSVSMNAHSMSPIATPLVIPQTLWVAGLIMFMILAVLLLVAAVRAAARGDGRKIQGLIGSRSAQEELAAELDLERDLRAVRGQQPPPPPEDRA